MALYGIDRYGSATYGPPSEAWPYLQVFIGTSRESDSLVLDDPDRGILDDATLGDNLGFAWESVANYVTDSGVVINRGSTRSQGPYFRYEAGRASFTLVNQDGAFDPTNTTSPYFIGGVSQLRPSLPVKVEALFKGVTYTLFVGYVDRWDVTYPGAGTTTSVVEVSCTDIVGVLAAADPLASPEQGTGDTVAARIDRILDKIGQAADVRDFDVATAETLQATTMAQAAWTDILLAADSFNGYVYADRAGVLQYRTKSNFPRAATVNFGEGGIPVEGLHITSDVEQVYNVVKLGRAGSSISAVEDTTSRALYGLRGYQRGDLICTKDDQVSQSLDYVLSQFSDLQLRVEAINVTAADTDPTSKWVQLLSMEMLTRVSTTVATPDGRDVSVEGLVRGLTLRASRFTWSWTLSTTQAPARGGNFTLDASGDGQLAQFTERQVEVLTALYEWFDTNPNSPFFGIAGSFQVSNIVERSPFYPEAVGWSVVEAFQFRVELARVYSSELATLISTIPNTPQYPTLAAF